MNIISLTKIFHFNRVQNWKTKYEYLNKKPASDRDFRSVEDYKLYAGTLGLRLIESVWLVIGLFTNNWIYFGLCLFLSISPNLIIKRISNTKYLILTISFLLIRISLYLYLILNQFK